MAASPYGPPSSVEKEIASPRAKLSKSEGGAVDEESLFTDLKKLMVRKSKLDDWTVEPSTMNVGTRKTRLAGSRERSTKRQLDAVKEQERIERKSKVELDEVETSHRRG